MCLNIKLCTTRILELSTIGYKHPLNQNIIKCILHNRHTLYMGRYITQSKIFSNQKYHPISHIVLFPHTNFHISTLCVCAFGMLFMFFNEYKNWGNDSAQVEGYKLFMYSLFAYIPSRIYVFFFLF